jgi:hypothetical protein
MHAHGQSDNPEGQVAAVREFGWRVDTHRPSIVQKD